MKNQTQQTRITTSITGIGRFQTMCTSFPASMRRSILHLCKSIYILVSIEFSSSHSQPSSRFCEFQQRFQFTASCSMYVIALTARSANSSYLLQCWLSIPSQSRMSCLDLPHYLSSIKHLGAQLNMTYVELMIKKVTQFKESPTLPQCCIS